MDIVIKSIALNKVLQQSLLHIVINMVNFGIVHKRQKTSLRLAFA